MLIKLAALLLAVFALAAAAISQNNSASASLGISASANVDLSRTRYVVATDAAAVSSAEMEAFDLINKKRADAGLEPLAWNEQLAALAREHSDDMAEFKYFSHKGTDGTMVDARADKLGIMNWSAIGENIAFNRGYSDAPSFAVTCWMESPGHRQNILDKRWNQSGIGAAILPDGTYYFTQVFLLRD
ncbi:MAG TPA: CAP domain-containing protein [Pyrinomonadaceae bacterium]|jgi:uncharacterized protein YkwD